MTKVEGNTITLTDKEGNTFTAELPKGLGAKVQVGDVFTLTLLRTPGMEKYTAGGLMRGDELKDRLNGFVEKAKGGKANTDQEKAKQAQDLDKLEGLLQRNMGRQQDLMQKVMDKAPPEAREALQKAKENSRQGWEQANESLQKARGKVSVTPTPTPTPQGEKGDR